MAPLLFLAWAVFSVAETAAAPATPPAGLPVHGRVFGPEGRGIAGARVELRPILSSYEEGVREAEGGGEPPPEVVTLSGEDGRFLLAAPRAGMWTVTVRAAGSVPMRKFLLPLLEPASLPDVVLPSDAGLRVRIEDADGRPVPGARVLGEAVQADRLWMGLDTWAPVPRQAVTGEDGEAHLARAEGEALRVWARAEGFAAAASSVFRGPALTLRLRRAEPRRLVVRETDGSAPPGLVVRDLASGLALGQILPGRMRARVVPGVTAVRLETADGRRVLLRLPEIGKARSATHVALPAPTPRTAPIVDRGRRPVAGAWVWPFAEPGLAVRSDALGVYRLEAATVIQHGALLGAAPGFLTHLEKVPGPAPALLPTLPTIVLDPAVSLSGMVVDAAGRPQADARIETVGLANADQDEPSLSRSAAAGEFRVSGLAAGKSYRITAYHPGSAPGVIALGPVEASVTGLRVVLRRGATLTGSVIDERGEPAAGVDVELLRETGQSLGRTATDAAGRFAIPDLPPGRGELILRPPGAVPSIHRPGIEIPEGRTADLGSLLISGGATLSGRITDPDGSPLAGVEVQVHGDGLPLFSRETAADGTFSIPGLEPEREIRIVLCHETWITVSLELPAVPSEPLALTLRPAAHLAGMVVDPEGSPVPYASLNTRRLGLSPQHLSVSLSCISIVPMQGTDAEGKFVLWPFAPGWYSLEAGAPGLGTGRLAVEVPSTGRDDLRIVLEPAAASPHIGRKEPAEAEARERHEVRGRVVGPDGGPVAGATVAANGVLTGTAADGSFLLSLTNGSHELQARAEDYSPAWQKTTVEVAGAPVDGVEIRLKATAELRGRISGLEPAELAWARVQAQPAASSEVYPGQVAADGSYRIARLAPGEWTVEAQAGTRQATQTFVLEPGEREAAVDMEFAEVSTVSGWVTGPRGQPMPGAKVAFWNDDTDATTATAQSDGSFALRLPEGSYTFNAYGGGCHLDGPDGTLEVAGVPVGGLEMRLVCGTEIHGRVIGFAGLAPGEVPWIQAEGPALVYAELELDGTFRLLDLDPGVWTVTAKLETEDGKPREVKRQVTVREGDGDIDLTIDLATDLALDPQDRR